MGMFDDLITKPKLFDDLLAEPAAPLETERFEGPSEIVLFLTKLSCRCGATYEFPAFDDSLARYKKFTRIGFGWKFDGFELLPCTQDFPSLPHVTEDKPETCKSCVQCHGKERKPAPPMDPLLAWRQALACTMPLDPELRHRLEIKASTAESFAEATEYEKALIYIYRMRRTDE